LSRSFLDRASGQADIPVSVTVSNPQQVGIYLLAAYYDVIGRAGTVSQVAPSDFGASEDTAAINGQTIRRFMKGTTSYLLQEGRLQAPGSFLEPGEKFDFTDTVSIPFPTSYDAIQVIVNIMVMRNDRVTLDPSYDESGTYSWSSSGNVSAPSWVLHDSDVPSSTHYIEWHARLETSYLFQLISRPKTVYVWYLLPQITGNIGPDLDVGVSTTNAEPSAPTSKDIQSNVDRYGLEFNSDVDISDPVFQLGIPVTK
jgi:hypothetical protein